MVLPGAVMVEHFHAVVAVAAVLGAVGAVNLAGGAVVDGGC